MLLHLILFTLGLRAPTADARAPARGAAKPAPSLGTSPLASGPTIAMRLVCMLRAQRARG